MKNNTIFSETQYLVTNLEQSLLNCFNTRTSSPTDPLPPTHIPLHTDRHPYLYTHNDSHYLIHKHSSPSIHVVIFAHTLVLPHRKHFGLFSLFHLLLPKHLHCPPHTQKNHSRPFCLPPSLIVIFTHIFTLPHTQTLKSLHSFPSTHPERLSHLCTLSSLYLFLHTNIQDPFQSLLPIH